jgi:hypothetical protein
VGLKRNTQRTSFQDEEKYIIFFFHNSFLYVLEVTDLVLTVKETMAIKPIYYFPEQILFHKVCDSHRCFISSGVLNLYRVIG